MRDSAPSHEGCIQPKPRTRGKHRKVPEVVGPITESGQTMPKRKGGEFRQQRSWFPDSFGQFIQWSFLCMPSTGKKPKNSMDELMSTNTNWHFYHLFPAIHLPKFLVWLLLTRPWDFDSGSSRGSEVARGSQCQVWRYPPRWLVSGAAFGLDLLRDTLDPLVIKRGNGESPHFMMVFPLKAPFLGYFPATFGDTVWRGRRVSSSKILTTRRSSKPWQKNPSWMTTWTARRKRSPQRGRVVLMGSARSSRS